MSRPFRAIATLAIAALFPAVSLLAQPPAPPTISNEPTAKEVIKKIEASTPKLRSTDPVERIKEEAEKKSQVMATLSQLTDVIGPRLTGSPGLKRANEWTRDKLASWGLEKAHLESWGPFGRGWSLKRFSAQVIEPQCIPLIAYPKAWSPGTDGVLVGEVVHFEAKTDADFAKYKGKLKGAIVLTGPRSEAVAHFEPLGTRLTDSQLRELADAPEPAVRNSQTPPRERRGITPERLAQIEPARKAAKFLADEGAGLLIEPSRQGDGGTLFVAQASIPSELTFGTPDVSGVRRVSPWDKDAPRFAPQVVMAKEHYNRLARMLKQGETLKMAVDLAIQFHDDDAMAYNTVAEIPGGDLKDEVVMLGGHLDSWHSGTGATDNAAGVAVALEAVRILKALDLKPRRTVRVALWTGEEQGLLGSRAYVTRHFGKTPAPFFGGPPPPASSNGQAPKDSSASAPTASAEFERFSAYFNLDNGAGKIRGVYLQGNEAVRPIFRKWLQPFKGMGATTLSAANTSGTDHLSFDGIGLPGFQFIQDPVEYASRTHHSNQDLYDRIQPADLKQAAAVLAAFVYNTAILDEKLPRKPLAH